jgi:hypothetical protein
MQTLLYFPRKRRVRIQGELAWRPRLPAGDVASSLARIDCQLGRDGEEAPDPLRAPPSSRGRRIWCSEE